MRWSRRSDLRHNWCCYCCCRSRRSRWVHGTDESADRLAVAYIFLCTFFLDLLHLRCESRATNSTRVSAVAVAVYFAFFVSLAISYCVFASLGAFVNPYSELVMNASPTLACLIPCRFPIYLLLSYKFCANLKLRKKKNLSFSHAMRGAAKYTTLAFSVCICRRWLSTDDVTTPRSLYSLFFLSISWIGHSLWLLKRSRAELTVNYLRWTATPQWPIEQVSYEAVQ